MTMRTDKQIIAETNELARYLLAELVGTGYQVPEDHKFYEAEDPRSKKAWEHAVKIMEMTTKTEMADVLATLEESPPKTLYRVKLCEKVYYLVDVEAESEEEARELAADTWAQSEDQTGDFDGQGDGVTVCWTEKLGS